VLVVLLFFSASHSKLATYILPVLPHLCILSARSAQGEQPEWSRRLSIGLGAALLAAAAAVPFLPKVPPEALPWAPLGVASLAVALICAGRLSGARARIAAYALGGLLLGACSLRLMNTASDLLSCKSMAEAIAAQARPQDAVWAYDKYPHGLPFYTRRRVDKIIYWIGELSYAKREPANAALFGDDTDVENLPLAGRRAFVAVPRGEVKRFMSMTPPGALFQHGLLGQWEMAEFLSAEELKPVSYRGPSRTTRVRRRSRATPEMR
jgi:hypothetical protein